MRTAPSGRFGSTTVIKQRTLDVTFPDKSTPGRSSPTTDNRMSPVSSLEPQLIFCAVHLAAGESLDQRLTKTATSPTSPKSQRWNRPRAGSCGNEPPGECPVGSFSFAHTLVQKLAANKQSSTDPDVTATTSMLTTLPVAVERTIGKRFRASRA